jgi:SET domain-containing protein
MHGIKGLEVKLSNIHGAGLGLFTKQAISKNQIITFYDGEIIDWSIAKKLDTENKSSHIRSLAFGFSAIDGFKKIPQDNNCGLGSFINDGFKNNNSKFKKVFLKNCAREIILVIATRFIEQNEEIFISYGNSYWKKHKSRK